MSPDRFTQSTAHISPNTTLQPTINAWQIYLEDQAFSPHTVKAFTADLRLLASFLPPDRTVGEITTTDLNNYLNWLQNTRGVPCSPKTLARRITSLKSMFRWLHNNGVMQVDPAEKVVQKSVISPLPTVLTPGEIDAVLVVANDHRSAFRPDARYYTLFSLLIHTGIKKGECLAISTNHVELDAPTGPLLFVRYTNAQYRYKERKIPLPDSWVEAYHEYINQYPLDDRLFPWSPRRLEYLLEDLGEECGLEKHISFDMCRWSCVLNDWRSGMEQDKIRQKLGVSKIQWREIRMKLERLSEQVG